nr:MAG TPA: hypothetical protein [Caudoviricetes sp.]
MLSFPTITLHISCNFKNTVDVSRLPCYTLIKIRGTNPNS